MVGPGRGAPWFRTLSMRGGPGGGAPRFRTLPIRGSGGQNPHGNPGLVG